MLDIKLLEKAAEINNTKVKTYKIIKNNIQKVKDLTGIELLIKSDKNGRIMFKSTGVQDYGQENFPFMRSLLAIPEDKDPAIINLYVDNKKQIDKELNTILKNYIKDFTSIQKK